MGLGDRSSSNDLSSAPSSDIENSSATLLTRPNTTTSATHPLQPQQLSGGKSGRVSLTTSATRQDHPVAKQSKPRKKKEVDPAAPSTAEKEKKPRKSRTSAATAAGRANKKLKTESDSPALTSSRPAAPATDLSNSRLVQPTTFTSNNAATAHLHEAAKTTRNGFSNQIPATTPQPQSPTMYRYLTTTQPQSTLQQPRSRFDPVRDIERSSDEPPPTTHQTPIATPPRPTFRPSASPAISSIINPPDPAGPNSVAYQITPTQLARPRDDRTAIDDSMHHVSSLVVKDTVEALPVKPSPPDKSTSETEVKPKRAKEQPPPVPTGSGLLNSTFFGGDTLGGKSDKSGEGTTIFLQIDLSKEENTIFNFSRLAEEKYGFAAVYPRQAAQKERLAKVAAAGAALERAASVGKRGEISIADSGDEDLSLDIDRESDNDGDVNMTGLNGTNDNSGTDGPVPKTRRKRKDEYDGEDPFVDDSEALWETQAATSKDGFFVYMGALVTEEKPTIEKSDGPAKRGGRGRGRGGGPGSRGGRGAASSAVGDPISRGGPGSRGSGVTRKPRITKAERQQRETEKKQREQAGSALAGKPLTVSV